MLVNANRHGVAPSCRVMDTIVIEAAAGLFGSVSRAAPSLSDTPAWTRLRAAAKHALPSDPARRLSQRATTRNRHCHDRGRFSNEMLVTVERGVRRETATEVEQARMFDPAPGGWTDPSAELARETPSQQEHLEYPALSLPFQHALRAHA